MHLRRRSLALLAILVSVPGVTSAQFAPTYITDAPGPLRAVASLLLVLVFGNLLLYTYGELVEDAISSSMDNPLNSTLYGILALGGVVFMGAYLMSQVGRLPMGGTLIRLGQVIALVAVFVLAGLGFTVVGTRITELVDERNFSYGVAIGAVMSGVALLIPSLAVAVLVWSLLVAVGVGGPTREWLHGTREGDTGG